MHAGRLNTRSLAFLALSMLSVPVAVSACEGQCMTDVTNEYLRRYYPIVLGVMQDLVSPSTYRQPRYRIPSYPVICCTTSLTLDMTQQGEQISTDLIPPSSSAHPRPAPISYLGPIISAWNSTAAPALTNAIFPSYFHGKCQPPSSFDAAHPNGVDPPGCPNPDCPVVCGTPGSMVHFYNKLVEIVCESVKGTLGNMTRVGSEEFKAVEKLVVKEGGSGDGDGDGGAGQNDSQRRTLSRIGRSSGPLGTRNESKPRRNGKEGHQRHPRDVQESLGGIMKQAPMLLQKRCGGPKLGRCRWTKAMQAFILRYP
ncbi:hypothetical protein BJ138DRAFT_1165188 [Hygrophoropsis aurantiaca]|uniref:Uncharacterized protein n=1 Tax=Hygrophoropsis aurantiaca TaxID=72124 RepID=A0ACB7ZXY7_9AGAM|nr:hypothetical protein BJ138DRAFT_1165188 [Hygrophoropsis aurantiaca]